MWTKLSEANGRSTAAGSSWTSSAVLPSRARRSSASLSELGEMSAATKAGRVREIGKTYHVVTWAAAIVEHDLAVEAGDEHAFNIAEILVVPPMEEIELFLRVPETAVQGHGEIRQ